MDAASKPPDQRAFEHDIESASFQLGLHGGRWRIGAVDWPNVQIGVSAARREGAPDEWWFRFECSGYPEQAVTARPWDIEGNSPLSANRWPGGRSRVPAVFRPDWKDGTCLYLPCDRITANGHADWRVKHPSLAWSAERGIVLYLEEVHALLNSSDYTGVRHG